MNLFIPDEIINTIITFCFGECEKCKEIIHFSKLTKNCRMFEYRNAFHDDFWSYDNIYNFNLVCEYCIKKYSGKVIINFENCTYCWLKKL